MKKIYYPKSQQGIALITVMLIVALATITAVAMTERQQYDIARTSNLLQNQQIYFHAMGGEQWARGLLKRDYDDDKNGNGNDNLNEDWAKELPVTPIENGTISGHMVDLQGRFNINNLYLKQDTKVEDIERVTQQKQYFTRLLKILEIEANIIPAIMDWLDPDAEEQFPDGAEDSAYLEFNPPYRAGNRRMISPTELLLVKGLDIEIYQKLQPYISTLPEHTPINVNTAPAQIIAALSPQLDLETAKTILEDRANDSFGKVADFTEILKSHVTNKDNIEKEVLPLISVSTRFFLVQADIQIGENKSTLVSLIEVMENGNTRLLYRSPGIY